MEELTEKEVVPWQKRKELGLIMAFYLTLAQVLFKPGKFFETLEIKKSYWEPLYFCFINYLIVIVISLIVTFAAKKVTNTPQNIFGSILGSLFIIILLPLILFLGAAIMHLFVLLFRGKGRLKGTFDVLAYASSATIMNLIPFVGGLACSIWGIVIGVNGYKRIHKFGTLKACIAYLLPLLLFIILTLAAVVVPNFIGARIRANDAAAKATVTSIAKAMESYKANNKGLYPVDEYDLRYGATRYSDKIYSNKIIQGYKYSLNLNANGYEITAAPADCRVGGTGSKIYTVVTGEKFTEKDCK